MILKELKLILKTGLHGLCLMLALLAGVDRLAAQGSTAFTYQGQLQDSGTNANGSYTMIFALYDSVTGGNQIGSAITNSSTLVNGLYSVNLDFGPVAFSGSARWLDITITHGGTAQELSPRIQVLPTPYAQFATVAATVTNGAITTAQIAAGAVTASTLALNAVNATNIASGQVVKSLNGLTDATVLSAGTGLVLSTNGNSLQLSATGGSLIASNNNLIPFTSVGKQVGALTLTNGVGVEYTVLSQSGAGCLTHMYFSGDGVSAMRIRVYVDGAAIPSIDMANDLGTGYAFSGYSPSPTYSPPGNSQMGQYGGIYNNYHIPFGNGIRVTVWPMWAPATSNLWWTIRGTQNLPLVVAGQTLPSSARLYLYRNEWLTVNPLTEFNLCNVTNGHGLVYQVMVAAYGNNYNGNANMNYLEGQVRAYFGGSTNATLLSSGTEDFFLGSGYFNQNELYEGEAAGLTSLNETAGNNSFSAYRLFTQDPFCFQNGLRLTLKCGEQINGVTIGTPQITTYATYTWVYQW